MKMLRLCNASVVVRRAPPEHVPRSHEPLTLLKEIIQEFLAPVCHTGGFSGALERTSGAWTNIAWTHTLFCFVPDTQRTASAQNRMRCLKTDPESNVGQTAGPRPQASVPGVTCRAGTPSRVCML